MQIEFRKLQANELDIFIELVSLFEEVFEMEEFRMPPRAHLQDLLHDKSFHVFVAISDRQEVLGGLTAYTLQQYYATKPLVYIYDLAVDSRHQRKASRCHRRPADHHCQNGIQFGRETNVIGIRGLDV